MSPVVRLLLTWLLVLALPAQGVAAATMQFCGPAHHAQDVAPPAMVAPAEGAHHHHLSTAADGAERHASHHGAPQTASKCSACSACCMATALLPGRLTVPAVELLGEAIRFASASYVGPDAVGLERPPRPFLA